VDCFEFSLRMCSTEPTDVAHFRGVLCLAEDEHLRKRAILDGSATGGSEPIMSL